MRFVMTLIYIFHSSILLVVQVETKIDTCNGMNEHHFSDNRQNVAFDHFTSDSLG